MRKLLIVAALPLIVAGCGTVPRPGRGAEILGGTGTTLCQVYVGNDGQAAYWDGMRTCTLHEVDMHQALPVGQR